MNLLVCYKHKLNCRLYFFALWLLPSVAFSYQFEANLAVDKVSYDSKNEYFGHQLIFEAFHEPLTLKDGPYAEQAFLSRISSVEFFVAQYDYDVYPQGSADFSIRGLSTRFMSPDSNYIYGLGLLSYHQKVYIDTDFAETDMQNILLSLGYYVAPELRLLLIIDYLESNTFAIKAEQLGVGFNVKALFNDVVVDATLTSVEYDDMGDINRNEELEINVDYYFNRAVSVGVITSMNRGQEKFYENDGYGVQATYYFTENSHFGLLWAKQDYTIEDSRDSDQLYTILGLRF